MKIVNSKNLKEVAAVDKLFQDAGSHYNFTFVEVLDDETIGIVVALPSFSDPDYVSKISIIRDRPRYADEWIDTVESINKEFEFLLSITKEKILQVGRINQAFNIQDNIQQTLTIN